MQSGVTITLGGDGSAATTTNGSGNYCLPSQVNGSYTVTPTLTGYTITPANRSVNVNSANVTGKNFVASTTAAAFTQADLTGTWRMNLLKTGTDTEWDRARVLINSSGVATCLSVDGSFTGGNVCPSPFDLKLTMNTTTGVITESGDNAADDGGHMTMTSNKNFMAGTATNNSGHSYQLMIVQKDEGTSPSYSAADIQSKSFVYHALRVGSTNGSSAWIYGAGTTDTGGSTTISSQTNSWGSNSQINELRGTFVVDGNGNVTLLGNSFFHGFMSDDKKTIVAAYGGDGSVACYIIQITGTEFTAGALPAGAMAAHMLGTGTGFAGWAHNTTTVAPGGGMTFDPWVDSWGG